MSANAAAQDCKHIDLVRHGRVATPGLFCAPPAEPLSDIGWQQLSTTTHLAQADVVITSPSQRCQAFATFFAEQRGLNVQTTEAFQEMHFGDWIGLSTAEIWAQDANLLQTLWQSPLDFTAPRGEKLTDFVQRVEQGWADLLTQHTGQRLLVFTHGGVIRVLLAQALGVPYQQMLRFELEYGSAVRMRVYGDGGVSVYGLGLRDLTA